MAGLIKNKKNCCVQWDRHIIIYVPAVNSNLVLPGYRPTALQNEPSYRGTGDIFKWKSSIITLHLIINQQTNTMNQCWYNVEPASQRVDQHYTNTGLTSRACWDGQPRRLRTFDSVKGIPIISSIGNYNSFIHFVFVLIMLRVLTIQLHRVKLDLVTLTLTERGSTLVVRIWRL